MTLISRLANLKNFMPPLKEVLSENGVGSYSRYVGFLIVVSTIFWITYLVLHTKTLPDLVGPTLWVTGAAGGHYAINQGKSVVAAWKGTPQQQPGDPNADNKS